MANIQSAKKRWRQTLRRTPVNRRNRSTMRSHIKALKKAIQNNDKEKAQHLLPKTFSVIDKTVKKGAIHKNTGDRYKSRLSRKLKRITPSSPS
ncbi:30S ribosomal protein S20 [bacterium]|nr:30S ribosomal protein S20 [bacterium]